MLIKRGRVWQSRIMIAGFMHQRSLKTRDKQEAARREAAFRLELTSGEFNLSNTTKEILARFEKRFFDYIDQNVASPKTRAYYKTHWVPLRDSALGGMEMSRINPSHIHDWATARATQVSPASVNGSLRTLRRALRLAQEWRLIRTVPKIRLVKGEHAREFIIDEKLLAKMLAHEKCTPMLSDLVPFLIDSGLRLNEAMSLKWDNVDFKDASVFVERGKSKTARRTVPLTNRAKEILTRLFEKKRAERVFTQSSFYVSHQFRRLRDAMKLPADCVLHSCRHTFCSRLGAAGVSAFQIMRLAGHSSVVISQRYVHEDQQALRDAVAKLANQDGVS